MSAQSRKKISQTTLPFKIGIVARRVFPALAQQHILNKHDVSFLISGRSGTFFATRKDLPVLRQRLTGDRSERLVDGFQRYYEDCIVTFEGCDYYLTKEWWNDDRHINLLLLWLFERGVDKDAVIRLCQVNAVEEIKENKLQLKEQVEVHSHTKTPKAGMSKGQDRKLNPQGGARTKAQLKVPAGFSMCKYVAGFLSKLEEVGFSFTSGELSSLCDKEWTGSTFHVWLPAFVPWAMLLKWAKDPIQISTFKRYWRRPFTFGGQQFGVCSQWYAWQKDYFDEWAKGIAERAGLPYVTSMVNTNSDVKTAIANTVCDSHVVTNGKDDVVVIDVSPLKKHTVNIKRK